jgi:hypothetical protein
MSKSKKSTILARIHRYLVYDLREIILPSPLPNPPEYKPPPRETTEKLTNRIRNGFSLYLETWKRKKEDASTTKEWLQENQHVMEEVKDTSHKGAKVLSALVKSQYKVRAAAYQEAAKEFISGYKKGLKEASDEKK